QFVVAGGGRADAAQVVARLVVEPVRVLELEQLREALHVPVGGAEVVSDGVEQLFHGGEARLQLCRALPNLCLEEFVGAFLVVDIRVGAQPFHDAAFGVAQRHAPRLEPAMRAIGAAQTIFEVERRLRLDCALPRGRRPLAISRIDLFEPAEAELPLLGNAGIAHPLRAHVIAAPVGQAGPYQLRQAFRQRAEARLALAQRLVGPLAVGDVVRHLRKTGEGTAFVPYGRDGSLDAKAGPVLAHAPTLVARPAFLPRRSQHLLRHAAFDVLGGEKDAKRFSDDLLGTITLDALGLRTPGGDAALGVQHVDRVSLRALRQRAEARLALV